jgi:hypothetical protein
MALDFFAVVCARQQHLNVFSTFFAPCRPGFLLFEQLLQDHFVEAAGINE